MHSNLSLLLLRQQENTQTAVYALSLPISFVITKLTPASPSHVNPTLIQTYSTSTSSETYEAVTFSCTETIKVHNRSETPKLGPHICIKTNTHKPCVTQIGPVCVLPSAETEEEANTEKGSTDS